jgi:hypothetical protein
VTPELSHIQFHTVDVNFSRRTWYRISRKETLREHNGGNEDYVRATWIGSSIRENTTKIVARWITEDRITGGVVLGGRNRPGAMFGWDEGAQRMPGKPQRPSMDLPPLGLRSKATPLEVMPSPFSLVSPQRTVYSAISLPIGDPTNSNAVREANTPTPQFGWSSFIEGDKGPVLDTPQSTSTHQRAISMIPLSPISFKNPPGVISHPSPRSRPASLDLSRRKTSESLQMPGPNGIGLHSSMSGLQKTSSAQGAIKLASPISYGNPPVRESSQSAAKVELHASKERRNPWPSADLSIFDGRTLTEVSSLNPREFGTLGVPEPSKEATEDEIVEVDRAIKRLPNLTYMLR